MIADSPDTAEPTPAPSDPSPDRCAGIEALRSAWGERASAFRELYEEHGPYSRATDELVAEHLSETLRAPISVHVVGRFRSELGLVKCRRGGASDGEGLFADASPPPAAPLPDPMLTLTAAAIQGLCARHSSIPMHEIGRQAVAIAQDAFRVLRGEGTSR